VRATVWLAPEVAVTVMLEIPGGVPLFGLITVFPPPPQLTMHTIKARPASRRQPRFAFLLVLKLPAATSPSAIPSRMRKNSLDRLMHLRPIALVTAPVRT
jgi:hypothetical protein